MRRWLKLLAIPVALAALAPRPARADGLRLGTSVAALRYSTPDGPVGLYFVSESARVSRGRAGLALSVPFMGISGGTVIMSDESIAVKGGDATTRFGLGDMAVALEYNVLQDRQHGLVATLGADVRFPTGSTAQGLGTGEHLIGLSLTTAYGIMRKLVAYAELRASWSGIVTPLVSRTKSVETGLVYWWTDKLGLTGSVRAADYGGRAPFSLDTNLGLLYEVFPRLMLNGSAIGGMFGGSPQAGGTFGFSFEI